MAYINLETNNADFRLILGYHEGITPVKQLPKDYTGILLEHVYTKQDNLEEVTEYKQYRALIGRAREDRTPVVLAESVMSKKGMLLAMLAYYTSDYKGLWYKPLEPLAFSAQEVNTDNKAVKYGDFLAFLRGLPLGHLTDGFITGYRNLLMAQKAESFAQFQISKGIKRPSVAIVVGAAHTGVVKALNLKPEERVSELVNDFRTGLYYNRADFHKGFLLEWSDEGWTKGEFEDSMLKLAYMARNSCQPQFLRKSKV